MDHSSPVTLVWDEKHIKALLGLHKYPVRLIQMEPWQTWIELHGGLENVLNHLRNSRLPPNQVQILNIVLAHPDASAKFYYSKLNLSPNAYFLRLKELIRSVLLQVNTWEAEPLQKLPKSIIPTNIPSALTPLIGAEKSLTTAMSILRRPGTRLLTLTGPGGVGKTRLAIAVGTAMLEDFPNGVFFVPLETINEPALLVTQIARSLNLEITSAQSLLETLKTYLRERQSLLILDNFEQLIKAEQIVTDLLQAAAQLKILVTSREALNLYGEIRFTVPELTRPEPGNLPSIDQLSQWPALDLFVQRVQARHPEFIVNKANLETIVDVCQRLDGLPLAIELAAAQVRWLPPDQALPHVKYGLKALRDISHDRPSRQRTLWDVIDWSYQLLPESERAILRRLAVFGREWSLDAAEAVCQMEHLLVSLQELVDKNLLRYVGQGEGGDARFQMLQPVREYAFDQLDIHAEAEQTQRRHACYFLEMIQSAEPAIGTPEQLRWVRHIKQERENLQIALQWMLDRQQIEMAFNLLGVAWRYYNMINIWDETKSWMERALAQGTDLKSAARVKVLWGAAWLATHYNDVSQQMVFAEQGLALAREIGDKLLIGLLLQNVGDGLRRRKQYDQSIMLLEESLSLFRQMNNQGEIAWVLYHIADTVLDRGERARSMEIRQESLTIFRAIGDQWAAASTLLQIGAFALEDGDYQLATEAETESLGVFRAIGAKQLINVTLYHLASLALRRGDFKQVQTLTEESLAISRETGDLQGVGRAFNLQGRLALKHSDLVAARGFFEKAQAIFQQIGDEAAILDNLEFLESLSLAEKRA